MKKIRPYFRKTDLLAVLLVVGVFAAGVLFLILNHQKNNIPATAEIKVKSELYEVIDLTEAQIPYTLTVEGNCPVTLEVSTEGVRFISSECPDRLCIHSGLIGANESAACLPAGVSVTVRGQSSPEVDGVVG